MSGAGAGGCASPLSARRAGPGTLEVVTRSVRCTDAAAVASCILGDYFDCAPSPTACTAFCSSVVAPLMAECLWTITPRDIKQWLRAALADVEVDRSQRQPSDRWIPGHASSPMQDVGGTILGRCAS